MQLHLEPIGGIAGDMFIAALLDAFPHLAAGVRGSIDTMLRGRVKCRLFGDRDRALAGKRFAAEEIAHEHRHDHTRWLSIRALLESSDLAAEVKDNAIGIFSLLVEAEGRVHGIGAEEVGFHELGAADSIADIVGAAYIIAALGEARWSVAPLPLGSGRVRTAHGLLPVPAPATALLLEGFATVDDGIAGERVTPTGAAILRWLDCAAGAERQVRRLIGSGVGLGAKSFPDISNCLRVLVFDDAAAPASHREIAVIEFEVDDQSAEDLAMGIERLRTLPSVFDVLQMPAFGKKGRMMTHVRVLAGAAQLEAVAAACFRETTTIGLRHRIVDGMALPRRIEHVDTAGRPMRVKTVERPGERTAKAESDDVADAEGHSMRVRLRQAAERQALEAQVPEALADPTNSGAGTRR